MARCKIEKGTETFDMFQDYWKLIQNNWDVEDNDEYWQEAIRQTDEFYKKYKTEFAKDLAVAYMNELERRYKKNVGV